MGRLLNRNICVAICAIAVFSALSATTLVIAGFVNLGTYESTTFDTTAPIWCGLLMYLHVFVGLLTTGTRHSYIGGLYIAMNCIGLTASIYALTVSWGFYDDFELYNRYAIDKVNYRCTSTWLTNCICKKTSLPTATVIFNDAFRVTRCDQIKLGCELWMVILVLSGTCILWSTIGAALGIMSIISFCFGKKGKDETANYNLSSYEVQSSRQTIDYNRRKQRL